MHIYLSKLRSCYYGFVQSKCAEKRDYTLNPYILALLMSLKDPSLTFTTSFSPLMPE